MKPSLDQLYQDSINLLQRLSTPSGIMASEIESDNYKRVWGRDSVISGLAGLLIKDQTIIQALGRSLATLAKHQNALGMIPSNVLENDIDAEVSYGSLVGRVDSNTWFIVGSCLYFQNTNDRDLWEKLRPAIKKCFRFLEAIQFNNKGWLYTPLSGNWADEYPVHGYTLYDNCLYLWACKLWKELGEQISTIEIEDKIITNFWPKRTSSSSQIYQAHLFEEAAVKDPTHFGAYILPGRYDQRFDAAGNALALLHFNLEESEKEKLSYFLNELQTELGHLVIPAFWPVIDRNSEDWYLLKDNFSFNFKNHPHHFHNGGVWPVWMGLFGLGLAKQQMKEELKNIVSGLLEHIDMEKWNFQEFLDSGEFVWRGKERMGYSASGIVFLYHTLHFEGVCDTLGL